MPPKSSATTVTHGRYTIRAMQISGTWKSRAFLTIAPSGTGHVAEATGDTMEAVILAARNAVDARERGFREARRYDEWMDFHIPSPQEYAGVIGIAGLGKAQMQILEAHAMAGDEGLTATELARAGGYVDASSANLHYGKAGRLIAEAIGVDVPIFESTQQEGPTGVLAFWRPTPGDPDGIGRWVMYPELRAALELRGS